MQRLLNFCTWNAGAVRDAVRRYVVKNLGDPSAVLAVDETGFLKKGPDVGVGGPAVHRDRGPGGERAGRGVPGVRGERRVAGADRPGAVPAGEVYRRSETVA